MGLARTSAGNVDQADLDLVRVGHDAADEVRAGSRHLGDEVGDEPARARFGGRDAACRGPGTHAPSCPARSSSSSSVEGTLVSVAGSVAARAGGANSHVSGIPLLPRAPSEVPLSVNFVTPDEPVRTSTDSLPVNVRVLPLPMTLPAAPMSSGDLAVDPDLEPGSAALDRDHEVDALVGDGHGPGDRRRLALGTRGRDGDRPLAGGQLERRR